MSHGLASTPEYPCKPSCTSLMRTFFLVPFFQSFIRFLKHYQYIMKILKKKYIYNECKTLPKIGWFQACYLCTSITSGVSVFDTFSKKKIIYEINVYVCSPCQKKLLVDKVFKKKYKAKCVKYINSRLFTYP
jgi:hypothetical protein